MARRRAGQKGQIELQDRSHPEDPGCGSYRLIERVAPNEWGAEWISACDAKKRPSILTFVHREGSKRSYDDGPWFMSHEEWSGLSDDERSRLHVHRVMEYWTPRRAAAAGVAQVTRGLEAVNPIWPVTIDVDDQDEWLVLEWDKHGDVVGPKYFERLAEAVRTLNKHGLELSIWQLNRGTLLHIVTPFDDE